MGQDERFPRLAGPSERTEEDAQEAPPLRLLLRHQGLRVDPRREHLPPLRRHAPDGRQQEDNNNAQGGRTRDHRGKQNQH